MGEKIIHMTEDNIQKILSELKEIQSLAADDIVKFRISQLSEIICEMSKVDSKDSLEQMIYKKMKEATTKNPELNVKLYMLYRNLTEGKISQKEAKEAYDIYVQMYPFDTLVY
ncbi:hypothetical protein IRP63_09425 [Clostridium botulinum]|uniref:Uncharacterized protein n=1 Tax=Clostridium botulinum C/D str. DC5 TaxID=1443128 RepID=A0A0A0IPS6_CLOBO|nr:hypothetical protein [Clostridium botulinum]KEI04648.1 hypothetical protein Z952_06690 [Clostridium botulinum C/D str. BKT75002]KEI06101.1 hypothetical protein Z954_05675 [Clostridium botulinum C/D str. BKT2873]KGM93694.1 hypothetical protein Z956_10240 [Clostridium botulinum D str. CCUG 7971]KGN01501.1 hypothetical protein Z955_01270 [Clostridium botulinum C/D str. DC5]KOC49820.1 hypothetical protein ADU88_05030 [Clostridium botulinum]